MAKENTTLKIKCDSVTTAKALFAFIEARKHQITGDIDKTLRSNGAGMTDATFENVDYEKLRMELTVNPQNKGDVFVLNEEDQITVTEYPEVNDKEIYGIIEGGMVILYEKNAEDIDTTLGRIDSLAQLEFNLKEAPKVLAEQRKAQQKQIEERHAVEEISEIEDAKIEEEVTNG